MHTGAIIDFYDDPQGLVLKEKLGADQVPNFIKEAQFLDESHRSRLPDDVFALVMLDRGAPMRKYACTDKGNTALSVIYLMENHHKLPEPAVKTAAANLLTACGWHQLKSPVGLKKLAFVGRLLNIGGSAMHMGDVVSRGAQRHARMGRGMPKVGDLAGSDIMPTQSTKEDKDTAGQEKTAALQPYVDVTGMEPPPRLEKQASERFCLVKEGQGQFPIDTYGEVMEAQQWFNDYGDTLHPEDRREFCTKLASRADEIGLSVIDRIRKYAGAGYAPDGEIKVGVSTRMQFWADDSPERDMLQGLMDKYAEVSPDVFCQALRDFDEQHGLDHYWDTGIYDPWYTTYGMEKKAEWTFEHMSDRITEERLRQVAHASYPLIREKFGEELADSLKKNPTQIFDSLPLDAKRIIMRMANDPQPSAAVVMGG